MLFPDKEDLHRRYFPWRYVEDEELRGESPVSAEEETTNSMEPTTKEKKGCVPTIFVNAMMVLGLV